MSGYAPEYEIGGVNLNLKGFAIGNGLTDPFAQYPAYATFSHENGLVSDEMFYAMETALKVCQGLILET
jgi:carboxypeptidase C (cathepsin A)